MKTTTYKNHHKVWKTESKIMLDQTRQLTISTSKKFNGSLSTTASVGTLENGFISHVVYQDYCKRLQTDNPKRITQKTNVDFHNKINFMEVINDAKQFYNIKQ